MGIMGPRELKLKWKREGHKLLVEINDNLWEVGFPEGMISRNDEILAYYHSGHPEPFQSALSEMEKEIRNSADRFNDSLEEKIEEMCNKELRE